jgi:sugar/nucleoside kinase (ribokinase family)
VLDVVSVGNFSIDSILLPNRSTPFVVLGGSTGYVSLAARRLGSNVSVISKVGRDFPEAYNWWLEQEGVDLSNVIKDEGAETTRFELEYDSDLSNRVLRLRSKAPAIMIEDLPASLRAKAIHIAPIADEITYEVAEEMRSRTDILSLELQGLIRDFSVRGEVSLKSLSDQRILDIIDVFKSSNKELKAATGISDADSAIKTVHDHGVKIVIVTLGAQGVAVSVEDTIHRVPAYKPVKVVDPTGAGDAFIGGFLAEYVYGEDCSWCSYVGSAIASIIVEGPGPTSLGDKDEIYSRANTYYGKEIKE